MPGDQSKEKTMIEKKETSGQTRALGDQPSPLIG